VILSAATRDRFRRLVRQATDLALVLTSLAVALATTGSAPQWIDRPRPVIAVAAVVGSLALWWRRRYPVAVTLLGAATFVLSANPVPLVVGLYTTAVRRRDLVLVAVSVVGIGALALPDAIDHPSWGWGPWITGCALALFPVVVGAYVGARRDLVASLQERADRAEAERELRAAQARAGERTRIAREMHDVLAHEVSLIALHAGALEVNAAAGPERVEESAALIRRTAVHALEELREVLGVLRSDDGEVGELRPAPRAEDIARLVAASQAAGVAVTLDGDVPDLPDAAARAVHRIVQEGLTNVHKHAAGAATSVAVAGDEPTGVTVSVRNLRPVGASARTAPLPGAGAGLAGLAERVRLLGGRFTSRATPDGGWRLEAWLPWSSPSPVARTDAPAPASDDAIDPVRAS
jgi:signal transduction histidine kinase